MWGLPARHWAYLPRVGKHMVRPLGSVRLKDVREALDYPISLCPHQAHGKEGHSTKICHSLHTSHYLAGR